MPHPTAVEYAPGRRDDRARRNTHPLRARVASALRGREPLSWTFWTMTVAGSALLTAVLAYAAGLLIPFLLAANRVGSASSMLPYQLFAASYAGAWLVFAAMCALAIWRCSANVSQPHWTYLARLGALVWLAWSAYGLVAVFKPAEAALSLSVMRYLTWPLVAVIASVAVTRARGGATFASVLALVLLFIGAALAPFVAAAIYLAGPSLFSSREALASGVGWGALIGMFYFAPAMAVATLTCFTYALTDKSAPRLGYASLAFVLLSAGILAIASSQRYFT